MASVHRFPNRLCLQVRVVFDVGSGQVADKSYHSVKWVGLFGATALVGLYTVEDLWNKFGDLKMPKVG